MKSIRPPESAETQRTQQPYTRAHARAREAAFRNIESRTHPRKASPVTLAQMGGGRTETKIPLRFFRSLQQSFLFPNLCARMGVRCARVTERPPTPGRGGPCCG